MIFHILPFPSFRGSQKPTVMKKEDRFPEIAFPTRQDWRDWLAANHDQYDGIWLVFYKKTSGKATVRYMEAVLEGLCFGWIDSKSQTMDEERYRQIFTPRKPKSEWSKANKRLVAELEEAGLMAEPGRQTIRVAKENGSWTKIDAIEDFILPPELEAAFEEREDLKETYEGFSNTVKKYILRQIYLAKRPETKASRLEKILGKLEKGEAPI